MMPSFSAAITVEAANDTDKKSPITARVRILCFIMRNSPISVTENVNKLTARITPKPYNQGVAHET
jgi:membrane-bound lytic murein transglycosylase MltF